MPVTSDIERADSLSRRRARTLPALVAIYIAQQASYLSSSGEGDRAVDQVKIAAWAVLSVLLLAALVTKGFWFNKRALRELIAGEVTQSNQLDAIKWGFVATVSSAVVLYFLQRIQPQTAGEVIHAIISISLGIALLRFAALERRSHRG